MKILYWRVLSNGGGFNMDIDRDVSAVGQGARIKRQVAQDSGARDCGQGIKKR